MKDSRRPEADAAPPAIPAPGVPAPVPGTGAIPVVPPIGAAATPEVAADDAIVPIPTPTPAGAALVAAVVAAGWP